MAGGDEGSRPPEASPAPAGEAGGGAARRGPAPLPGLPRLGLALALLVALLAAKHYRDSEAARRQEMALNSLGNEGFFLFSSLDINNDLYISPEEFKPIAEKLAGIVPVSNIEEEEVLDPSGETLTIFAKFQPLLMETMTKSKDGFLGISHFALSGLRNWTAPASPLSVMFAQQFKAFLPPKNKLDPGDLWWVIPSELNIFTGYLPNNRFYPPAPKGKEIIIHKLLSMFHPRPFVKTRFAPQGAVACIQAVADFYYKIAFRIHAEFQLNEPPDFPFWFSPAQFTGYVILSKDSSHVREFKLFVPNSRSLNVDMEWLYGTLEGSNMEVDIGYLPQMELESLGPSIPSVIHDENGNVIDSREEGPIQFIFEEIAWQREISWEEAAGKLEVAMYPFKKVRKDPPVFADKCPTFPSPKPLRGPNLRVNLCIPYCCGVRWTISPAEVSNRFCSGRTLRETVLESSPILAFLNENFISTWSLVKELEDLQAKRENEVNSKLAKLHLEKYNFPVEIMICLPNGTVVHHINANYFLDITSVKPEEDESRIFSFSTSFEDPSTATYLQFLKEGLQKAKPFLQA
ncbi:Selenoprotein N [Varanus komodoensis]|nr:Selenoprotein N [Varanus komodoensis]